LVGRSGIEQRVIRGEQEARFEPDAWEQLAQFLDGLPVKKTTVIEVAIGALQYEKEPPIVTPYQPSPVRGTPINRLSPGDQRRIASILTHLKWVPRRDNQTRWWEPS